MSGFRLLRYILVYFVDSTYKQLAWQFPDPELTEANLIACIRAFVFNFLVSFSVSVNIKVSSSFGTRSPALLFFVY